MRIYIGPENTAGVAQDLEMCLRNVGLDARFIPWSTGHHRFFKKSAKEFQLISLSSKKLIGVNVFFFINEWVLKPLYFLQCLILFDAFLFIKPHTFFRSNIDLWVLNALKKKVFIFYVGCNDRNPSFSKSEDWICRHCQDAVKQTASLCNKPEAKRDKALKFSFYSNEQFGFPDNLDFIKPKGSVLRLSMPPIEVLPNAKEFPGKWRILHLPSNPKMKGTSLIIPVLRELENRDDVEVIIKDEAWSRERMIAELRRGHILIDSLVEYTFGKMSLEAIQYGCLPFNAYPDWIANIYDGEIVVPATRDNLKQKIEGVIANKDLWFRLISEKQGLYSHYFSIDAVGAYYKEKLL